MKPYRKPVPMEPAGYIREKSKKSIAIQDQIKKLYLLFPNKIINIYLLLRTVLLSGFLASISIAIGLYSYRIYDSNPRSLVEVMDSVFKQSLPSIGVIQITSVSGLIFAIIFYGEYVRTRVWQVEDRLSNLSKFFAGIVLIIYVDIQMYKIDFYSWMYKNVYPPQLSGVFAGQVISIIFVMMLMPVFKKLLKIVPSPSSSPVFSDATRKLLNNIRYYLVSLTVMLLITYLSTVSFKDKTYIYYLGLNLPIVRSGVFLMAFGFAVLFNRPPKSLDLVQSFTFLRFVLGVLCFLGVGFFYGQAANVEMYLVYVFVVFILSWLSNPIVVLLC